MNIVPWSSVGCAGQVVALTEVNGVPVSRAEKSAFPFGVPIPRNAGLGIGYVVLPFGRRAFVPSKLKKKNIFGFFQGETLPNGIGGDCGVPSGLNLLKK